MRVVECDVLELNTRIVSPTNEAKSKGFQFLGIKGNIKCFGLRLPNASATIRKRIIH